MSWGTTIAARSGASLTAGSEPGEALVGVTEVVELDPHPIHDPQVHATELPLVVVLVGIVEHAAGLERPAEPAGQDNRDLAGVVPGPGPEAVGEEQAGVVEHRTFAFGHGVEARGEVSELA